MRAPTASLLTALILVAGFFAYSNFGGKTPDAVQTAPQTKATEMTADARTAFRREVRAYLMDSPEVLMEAISVLQTRQADEKTKGDKNLVADNADAIFKDGYSWVGGNPDGDVTLVEFMDYRCAYCRRAHPEVAELLSSDGNIRFIRKEFPILGKQSTISSKLAVATLLKAGPEAYAKLSDFLIAFNGNLTPPVMKGILAKFEIEADPVLAYMDSDEVTGVIAKNHALATTLQINGTPTFVLGTELMRGYVPLASMKKMVKSLRAERG